MSAAICGTVSRVSLRSPGLRLYDLQRPILRNVRDIGLDAEPRRFRQHDLAILDVSDGAAKIFAQRIVVTVDLQQPTAAAPREQMRRRQQADAATKKMRAIMPLR